MTWTCQTSYIPFITALGHTKPPALPTVGASRSGARTPLTSTPGRAQAHRRASLPQRPSDSELKDGERGIEVGSVSSPRASTGRQKHWVSGEPAGRTDPGETEPRPAARLLPHPGHFRPGARNQPGCHGGLLHSPGTKHFECVLSARHPVLKASSFLCSEFSRGCITLPHPGARPGPSSALGVSSLCPPHSPAPAASTLAMGRGHHEGLRVSTGLR